MNSMFNPSFLPTFFFNNTGRRFTYTVYTFMLVLMVCSMPQSLFGQTQAYIPPAESYFHQGAQQFIYNNLEAAISAVETGLERYPDDLKLQSLYEQLKEQQQQDQDSQNEQDNGDQNEENSEQNSEQQKNEENSESEEQESENEDQSQSQDEQAPDDSDPSERAQAEELKDLSKEEAQKILQALAQKEKELLKEFKKAKTKGGKTHEKDW